MLSLIIFVAAAYIDYYCISEICIFPADLTSDRSIAGTLRSGPTVFIMLPDKVGGPPTCQSEH